MLRTSVPDVAVTVMVNVFDGVGVGVPFEPFVAALAVAGCPAEVPQPLATSKTIVSAASNIKVFLRRRLTLPNSPKTASELHSAILPPAGIPRPFCKGKSEAEVTDVVTVMVELTGLDPKVIEFGANEHAAAEGSPEQLSVTGLPNGGLVATRFNP